MQVLGIENMCKCGGSKKIPCVYMIISPSKKIYIGKSQDFVSRVNGYIRRLCKHQPRLNRSFQKYGVTNHSFQIVEYCEKEALNEREKYYISLYNTFQTNHGLNLAEGGIGGEISDESKLKISKKHKGRIISQEQREKISKTLTGRVMPYNSVPRTEEQKKRISETLKNKYRSGELVVYNKGLVGQGVGRKDSEEIKKKKSDSAKGRIHTFESKIKMRIAKLGKKITEETKLKMSISHKKRLNIPQYA